MAKKPPHHGMIGDILPGFQGETIIRSGQGHGRLWKAGVRDLVMEICCALHNFRVRLTPWQPMV